MKAEGIRRDAGGKADGALNLYMIGALRLARRRMGGEQRLRDDDDKRKRHAEQAPHAANPCAIAITGRQEEPSTIRIGKARK
jgi:hypothetical protein